jgi:hypothetical protein
MVRFQQKYEATESNQPETPEQYLWMSVISKAAHDAIYTSDWVEARKAIEWFKTNKKDFKAVCTYAGLNPQYVYEKMSKPIGQRETMMDFTRRGNRYYCVDTLKLGNGGVRQQYHSRYRSGIKRGPYNVKKKKGKVGRPRQKDPYYVKMGKLGGRPRIYNGI